MEFYCQKIDGVLIGADEESKEKLKTLGGGTVVKCQTSEKRNYKNLQRFFRFRDVAFDMQEKYKDREIFRKVLLIGAGYFDLVESPRGRVFQIAHSIAFESMEEEEFKILFKKCIDYFLQWMCEIKSMTNEQFMAILDFD